MMTFLSIVAAGLAAFAVGAILADLDYRLSGEKAREEALHASLDRWMEECDELSRTTLANQERI